MTGALVFAGIGLATAAAERVWPARPQPALRTGLALDALYLASHVAIRFAFLHLAAAGISAVGEAHVAPLLGGPHLGGSPLWIEAPVAIVLFELVFYATHRLKHRLGWWWRIHAIHHSSREVDWFSSIRFHPLGRGLDVGIYFSPLLLLRISDDALLVLTTANAFFGFFGHANLACSLGPLRYVFVGPEMHRLHHAEDPELRDRNFGNILSVFDWLFGTAVVRDEPPAAFGAGDPALGDELLTQLAYPFRRSDASP